MAYTIQINRLGYLPNGQILANFDIVYRARNQLVAAPNDSLLKEIIEMTTIAAKHILIDHEYEANDIAKLLNEGEHLKN